MCDVVRVVLDPVARVPHPDEEAQCAEHPAVFGSPRPRELPGDAEPQRDRDERGSDANVKDDGNREAG